jgi:hypothetical protein
VTEQELQVGRRAAGMSWRLTMNFDSPHERMDAQPRHQPLPAEHCRYGTRDLSPTNIWGFEGDSLLGI